GAVGAYSLDDVIKELSAPRVIWMMLPAGQVTTDMIDRILPMMTQGDILVDGGNSNWKDSVSRAKQAELHGIRYLDAGVSGGIWGLEVGYCTMVGGDPDAFAVVEPAIKTLAPVDGYKHVGPSGAGHFSKMIHNGIEYGMLQAYAEGFEILKASPNSGTTGASCAPGSSSLPSVPSTTIRTSIRFAVMSMTPARVAGRCSRRSRRTFRL